MNYLDQVLATNTSTYKSGKIAISTSGNKQSQLAELHFSLQISNSIIE